MKEAAGALCGLDIIWRTSQNYVKELAGALCGSCMEGLLLTLREGGSRCSMLLCYNLEDVPNYEKELAGALCGSCMEDLLLTLREGGSRCSMWSCYGWSLGGLVMTM